MWDDQKLSYVNGSEVLSPEIPVADGTPCNVVGAEERTECEGL